MRLASVASRRCVLIVGIGVAWVMGAVCTEDVRAEDVREEVRVQVERAKGELDAGLEAKDGARIASAERALAQARARIVKELQRPDLSAERASGLRHDLVDLDIWLSWAKEARVETEEAARGEAGGAGGSASPQAAARSDGALIGARVKQLRALYEAEEAGVARAVLAQRLAAEGGIHAVPCLVALWKVEQDAKAREGLHDALATLGGPRVAQEMRRFARRDQEARWADALDVVIRALEKPERNEPERPWLGVVRDFHQVKERKLSLRLVERLDKLGVEGTAALGEILYVEDIGYHEHVIGLLAKRKDRRAVPPLVFKLNRFAFEAMEQMPAHKALLQIGWYAVPELIDRLDDKAAGIWISWTLRKITGETMGTDKRKWHDWWKGASLQHPELFEDPEERPGGAPVTGPTTPTAR